MSENGQSASSKFVQPTITKVILRTGLSLFIVLWYQMTIAGVYASPNETDVSSPTVISGPTEPKLASTNGAGAVDNEQTTKEPTIDQFDQLYYDFEVNANIGGKKASNAYHKLQSLTEEEKRMLKPEVYDILCGQQCSNTVRFVDAENIGIMHVIARMLSQDIEKLQCLCSQNYYHNPRAPPSFEILVSELACHIVMRKKNGAISLKTYGDYLYTIPCMANRKYDIEIIDNLKDRAIIEANLLYYFTEDFYIAWYPYEFLPEKMILKQAIEDTFAEKEDQ